MASGFLHYLLLAPCLSSTCDLFLSYQIGQLPELDIYGLNIDQSKASELAIASAIFAQISY